MNPFKSPLGNLTLGVGLFIVFLFLYINVTVFYTGNVTFVQNLFTAYFFLFIISFIIFRLQFPNILSDPKRILVFVVAFFAGAIAIVALPHFPATIVGSIADQIHAVAAVGFIQSFVAGYIETLVFIYAIYKVIPNRVTSFIVSNALFVLFHMSVIYSKVVSTGINPLIPVVSLLILNSVFQLVYRYAGGDKKAGIEAAIGVHTAWDLGTYGLLLPLLGIGGLGIIGGM